jgi:hypothetical protein
MTQLHVAERRGAALLGDVNATRRAMREAEGHYERSRPGEEPTCLGFYTDDSLAADLGRCLRDTGEPGPAAKLITQAVAGVEPWQILGRTFFETDLASAHLAGRDLERAAAEVSSSLTLDRLRTLQRQLHPLRCAPAPGPPRTWPISTRGSPTSSPAPPAANRTTTSDGSARSQLGWSPAVALPLGIGQWPGHAGDDRSA